MGIHKTVGADGLITISFRCPKPLYDQAMKELQDTPHRPLSDLCREALRYFLARHLLKRPLTAKRP